MKIAAFDIETAESAPNEDQGDYNLGITCAAIVTNDDPAYTYKAHPLRYDKDDRMVEKMDWMEVRNFIQALCEMREQGYAIASINGLGFDFRVLAEECQTEEQYANVVDLALNHYDPGFQMFCHKGWMQGLEGFSRGALVKGKMDGMDGLKAIEMWNGTLDDQLKVVEYVVQDAAATARICDVFDREKEISWIGKTGYAGAIRISRLLTVRECLMLPLPIPPSWVREPWPRDKFSGWLKEVL